MITAIVMVLIAAVVIGIVAWPLVSVNYFRALTASADTLTELTVQRDAALKAIKDLEFDRETGKVSADDFPIYDRRLREQALQAMQALDAFQAAQRPALQAPRPTETAAFDDQLEAEIAARRQRVAASPVVAANLEQHLEAEIAAQRAQAGRPAATAVARRFCSQCGQPLRPADRFCGACGAPAT